jgi:hypothetical protein
MQWKGGIAAFQISHMSREEFDISSADASAQNF